MAKAKAKFPKTLYVFEEDDGDGGKFFISLEKPENCDDGQVAIYELSDVKNKRTETILE